MLVSDQADPETYRSYCPGKSQLFILKHSIFNGHWAQHIIDGAKDQVEMDYQSIVKN